MKQIVSFFLLFISLEGFSQKMLTFKEANLPILNTTDNTVIEWNKNQSEYASLSLKEQEFYYWVNYSRVHPAAFFDSVVVPIAEVYPQLRGSNFQSLEKDLKGAQALPMFDLNATLNKMAAAQASDITSHDAKPSHNSTDGESFDDRYKKYRLKSCGGENISFGAQSSEAVFMLVLLYLDLNVPDLGHREALLNPSYINTGISAAAYKNGSVFVVEDFACSQK